jgi:uncharacterized protein (TIGR03067 family)
VNALNSITLHFEVAMNRRWTTVGTLALLLLASQLLAIRNTPAQDAPKAGKEEKKYRFVSLMIAGKELGKEDLKGMVLVLKGDHGTLLKDDKEILTATSKIDRAKKPWTMDIEITSGDEKGKTMKCILEVKDGRMRVCVGKEGGPRPTEFSSTEENGQILEVLEEIKGKD